MVSTLCQGGQGPWFEVSKNGVVRGERRVLDEWSAIRKLTGRFRVTQAQAPTRAQPPQKTPFTKASFGCQHALFCEPTSSTSACTSLCLPGSSPSVTAAAKGNKKTSFHAKLTGCSLMVLTISNSYRVRTPKSNLPAQFAADESFQLFSGRQDGSRRLRAVGGSRFETQKKAAAQAKLVIANIVLPSIAHRNGSVRKLLTI
jgi:hypothetical protein